MIKVQILSPCNMCGGEAYVPRGEVVGNSGEPYTRYDPCPYCEGTGNRAKWISLQEFADLLDKLDLLEALPTEFVNIPHHEIQGVIP